MRTEDQKCTMGPSTVTIGESQLNIKPLTVTKQATWRDKMVAIMEPILVSFRAENTPQSFANAYGTAIRNAPEVFATLVAEYAGTDPQKMKDEATPEQIVIAFQVIMEMAYPFAKPLETVTRLTSQA